MFKEKLVRAVLKEWKCSRRQTQVFQQCNEAPDKANKMLNYTDNNLTLKKKERRNISFIQVFSSF